MQANRLEVLVHHHWDIVPAGIRGMFPSWSVTSELPADVALIAVESPLLAHYAPLLPTVGLITTDLLPEHAELVCRLGLPAVLHVNSPKEVYRETVEAAADGRAVLPSLLAKAAAYAANQRLLAVLRLHELLTPSEVELLRQIGCGRSLKDIAAATKRSYQSVRQTAAGINAKLGLSTSAQAAILASCLFGSGWELISQLTSETTCASWNTQQTNTPRLPMKGGTQR